MTNRVFAFAALAVAAVALQLPTAAVAKSAFAAGIPSDVAAQGVSVGTGYNFSSRGAAEDRAMSECKAPGSAPASTKALCVIIAYFDNECLAVAFDPADGTPGFGWSVGATKSIAEARSGYCEVRISDCDNGS
jgi:hypothetical protein